MKQSSPSEQPDGSLLDVEFGVASGGTDLGKLRQLVGEQCTAAGLDQARCEDFVLAVHEIAANAILYAGGGGRLTLRRTARGLRCLISDGGTVVHPARRQLTSPDTGRGLWLAAQLADELTITSGPDGTLIALSVDLS
jgi:serine/threonine-protein kinase RsbW